MAGIPMKDGHRLYVTAHYAFNYDDEKLAHMYPFDALTQFFEKRMNLRGFISDEEGDRLEEGSEVDILIESLYEAFDNRDIPGLIERLLHDYEMYEILAEYHSPLEGAALDFKNDLVNP